MNQGAQVWRIARFEFARHFKWKRELLTLAFIALGFLLVAGWPLLAALFESQKRIAFAVEGPLPQQPGFEYRQIALSEAEGALAALEELWDGVVLQRDEQLHLYVPQRSSWQKDARAHLAEWSRARQLEQLPLDTEQRARVVQLPEVHLQVQGSESTGDGAGLLAVVTISLITVGLMTGAALMMITITAEKQQRVTEQLLTLVHPRQWMTGKILGVTLFAIKSVATTALAALLLIGLVALLKGGGLPLPGSWPVILLNSGLFLVLGLLLANCFMAGFSATIDDPNHSSRSVVMFAPMLPVMFGFWVVGNPDSGLSLFLSLFPLTSYAAMPVRVAETGVPLWQWVLSILLLAGCIWGTRNLAARLFAMGIQMYGKEPGWKDIWRAIRG